MVENSIHSPIELPPGFRFHPSDEELIAHYLLNKVNSKPVPALIIADIDLYKYNPWDLPSKALFGENEWYFFSPRDRKYPNGERPNRAAASGYWKATGTDKPILSINTTSSCGGLGTIGVKKGLVFYVGRPPRGSKTDWIMNEYRVLWGSNKRKGSSMRLDDWVLCRVRQKGNKSRNVWDDRNSSTANYESPSSNLKNTHYDSQNYLTDVQLNLAGWPLLNQISASSQDDHCSMRAISSLTEEEMNNELEQFGPYLKRKQPEDLLDEDYAFDPSTCKKKIMSEGQQEKGEEEEILSSISNNSYNIEPVPLSSKEDLNAAGHYFSLDNEWDLFHHW